MEKETTSVPKNHKLLYKIINGVPLESFWSILKNMQEINKVTKNKNSIILINGDKTYITGSIFLLKELKSDITFKFTVTQVNSHHDAKYLRYKVEFEESEFELSYGLQLSDIENKLLLSIGVEQIKAEDESGLDIIHNFQEQINYQVDKLKDLLEKETIKQIYYQSETMLIPASKSLIWKYVSNIQELKIAVPKVVESFELITGNSYSEVGAVYKISFKNKSKKCYCTCQVVKVINEKTNHRWEFHVKVESEEQIVPNQLIVYKITELSDNNSFLEFLHKFDKPVSYKYSNLISEEKTKILLTFKKFIDKCIKQFKNIL